MILNKTRYPRERYQIINGSQGCYGDPDYYPTHIFCIVDGVDRGNGYQGYTSVTYFLKNEGGYFPEEAIKSLKNFLKENGYRKYLKEVDPLDNGLAEDEFCNVCGNGILHGYSSICNHCEDLIGEDENA